MTTSRFKCPYGHKFGTDHDQKIDCEECDIWDECREQMMLQEQE